MGIKTLLTQTIYANWCALGFVRGIYSYKYSKHRENQEYKPINALFYGLLGISIYGNPIFLPLIIPKESYKLHVNINNLESEKSNPYYSDLI